MMSPQQRNAIFNGMPTILDGTTVTVMRKDRQTDPLAYPALRLSVLTEGTKVGPSTNGPIQKWYDEYQDAQQYYGDFCRSTISISVECLSDVSGTDAAVNSKLSAITYDLLQQIRFYGLGLFYKTDYISVWNILATAPLPPFFDEKRHRWVYRKVVDVLFQYSFQMLDPRSNITAIDWDYSISPHVESVFGISTTADIELSEVHAPSYAIDMLLRGDRVPYTMDMILTTSPEHEFTQSMDMIISW